MRRTNSRDRTARVFMAEHAVPSSPDLADRPDTASESELREPPSFAVLMHNDHYTTMEFVVHVLESVFYKSPSEATRIMLAIHRQGVGQGDLTLRVSLEGGPCERRPEGRRAGRCGWRDGNDGCSGRFGTCGGASQAGTRAGSSSGWINEACGSLPASECWRSAGFGSRRGRWRDLGGSGAPRSPQPGVSSARNASLRRSVK